MAFLVSCNDSDLKFDPIPVVTKRPSSVVVLSDVEATTALTELISERGHRIEEYRTAHIIAPQLELKPYIQPDKYGDYDDDLFEVETVSWTPEVPAKAIDAYVSKCTEVWLDTRGPDDQIYDYLPPTGNGDRFSISYDLSSRELERLEILLGRTFGAEQARVIATFHYSGSEAHGIGWVILATDIHGSFHTLIEGLEHNGWNTDSMTSMSCKPAHKNVVWDGRRVTYSYVIPDGGLSVRVSGNLIILQSWHD